MKNIVVLAALLLAAFQTARSQHWTHVGPKSDNQQNSNGFESSRLEDITFDRANPNHMFASGLLAGLWETTNGGNSWAQVPIGPLGTCGIGDVAFWNSAEVLVANSHFRWNRVYAGPHQEFSTGVWIYNFTSGNWYATSPLGSNLPQYHIRTVATKQGKIFVCTSIGLFVSTNAGLSWQQTLSGKFVENIVFVDRPGAPVPYYCFIAGSDAPGNQSQPTGKVMVMESVNGGQTFTDLSVNFATPQVESHANICVAPTVAGSARLFTYTIARTGNVEKNYVHAFSKNVAANTTGSYQNMNSVGNPLGGNGYIPDRVTIEYDPVNDGVWYGGTKIVFKDVTPGTSNNTSPGVGNWNSFHSQGGVHDDTHDIKLLPGTNKMYVASDGGIMEMVLNPPASPGANPSVTFNRKNQGLHICIINGFSGTDDDPNLYAVGGFDIVNSDVYDATTGKNRYTHQTWENDGALIDKFSKNRMWFDMNSYSSLYGTSNDGGQTLLANKQFYHPKNTVPFEADLASVNTQPTDGFTTRLFFQDPYRPGRIFFVKQHSGISQYYVNPTNPAQSVFTKKVDIGTLLFQSFGIHGWAIPKAVSFSPQTVNSMHIIINGFQDIVNNAASKPSVIKYVGSDIEDCWAGHNHDYAGNNPQWQDLTPGNFWQNAHTLGLCATAITPAEMYGIQFLEIETSSWNKDVIYVLLMVPNHPDIKILKYDGTSWTNYGQNIPSQDFVYSMIMDYQTNDDIYLSTDKGVYFRDATPGVNAWTFYNTNMPALLSRQMEINYGENTVRAGTFGQGIWKSDLKCPAGPLTLTCQNCNGPNDFFREGTTVTASNTLLNTNKLMMRATDYVELLPGTSFSMLDPTGGNPNDYYQMYIHGCGPGQGNTYRQQQSTTGGEVLTIGEREIPAEIREKMLSNVAVFPNPSTGSFTLTEDWTGEKDIFIFDAMGKLVFQLKKTSETSHEIDLINHPKGMYIIQVTDGINSIIRRVVIE